jgi:hypothetical protein
MTLARLRSHFEDPTSRASTFIVARYRGALILLVRGIAGGVLISGITRASRLMYRINWQTDSAIAAIGVVGWVVCLELVTGVQ